jgi:hypothetical protein
VWASLWAGVSGGDNLDAKEFLSQPKKLDLLIKNKLIEKQQWRDLALGITANLEGERVQSSGSKQKMADAITKCIDMEAEIDNLVDRLIDKKKEVIQVIEQLDSPIEYDILHRIYIQYMTLQEVADHYGKEYGWATTTHGRALKGVQRIREGSKDVPVTN